jgi:type II secretory pathway component PulL
MALMLAPKNWHSDVLLLPDENRTTQVISQRHGTLIKSKDAE